VSSPPAVPAPYEPPRLEPLGFVHELTLAPPGKTRSGPDAFGLRGGGGLTTGSS
jgi:hypothetical protein